MSTRQCHPKTAIRDRGLWVAQALGKAGVEYGLHLFPEGRHGLGLCSIGDRHNAYIARWRELCAQWLERQGF